MNWREYTKFTAFADQLCAHLRDDPNKETLTSTEVRILCNLALLGTYSLIFSTEENPETVEANKANHSALVKNINEFFAMHGVRGIDIIGSYGTAMLKSDRFAKFLLMRWVGKGQNGGAS